MGDGGAKVLMVVQPAERNVFDQRWIAAQLWEQHGIRTVRATLKEIHEGAALGGADGKALLYGGRAWLQPDYVLIVYLCTRTLSHSHASTGTPLHCEQTVRARVGTAPPRGDTFSVVYFRAGYTPTDFPGEVEWAARELLERSAAVKSPSAAMHLAGCKKVQQVLAAPGRAAHMFPATSYDVI